MTWVPLGPRSADGALVIWVATLEGRISSRKRKRLVGIVSPGCEGESPYLWIGEEVIDLLLTYNSLFYSRLKGRNPRRSNDNLTPSEHASCKLPSSTGARGSRQTILLCLRGTPESIRHDRCRRRPIPRATGRDTAVAGPTRQHGIAPHRSLPAKSGGARLRLQGLRKGSCRPPRSCFETCEVERFAPPICWRAATREAMPF